MKKVYILRSLPQGGKTWYMAEFLSGFDIALDDTAEIDHVIWASDKGLLPENCGVVIESESVLTPYSMRTAIRKFQADEWQINVIDIIKNSRELDHYLLGVKPRGVDKYVIYNRELNSHVEG